MSCTEFAHRAPAATGSAKPRQHGKGKPLARQRLGETVMAASRTKTFLGARCHRIAGSEPWSRPATPFTIASHLLSDPRRPVHRRWRCGGCDGSPTSWPRRRLPCRGSRGTALGRAGHVRSRCRRAAGYQRAARFPDHGKGQLISPRCEPRRSDRTVTGCYRQGADSRASRGTSRGPGAASTECILRFLCVRPCFLCCLCAQGGEAWPW